MKKTATPRKAPLEFKPIELKIMKLLHKQSYNQEIADKLGMNLRTIEGYRKKLLDKTKSKNSVGIVLYALKHGIV
jgi:DNA-binding NarL/FixJ family response regulator